MTNKKLKLLEELHRIDNNIEKAKFKTITESDKDNVIRTCQAKRHAIETHAKDLSIQIGYLSYKNTRTLQRETKKKKKRKTQRNIMVCQKKTWEN